MVRDLTLSDEEQYQERLDELNELRQQKLAIERRIRELVGHSRRIVRHPVECLRCGYDWTPDNPFALPRVCPRCGTGAWNKPPTATSRKPGDPPAESWLKYKQRKTGERRYIPAAYASRKRKAGGGEDDWRLTTVTMPLPSLSSWSPSPPHPPSSLDLVSELPPPPLPPPSGLFPQHPFAIRAARIDESPEQPERSVSRIMRVGDTEFPVYDREPGELNGTSRENDASIPPDNARPDEAPEEPMPMPTEPPSDE